MSGARPQGGEMSLANRVERAAAELADLGKRGEAGAAPAGSRERAMELAREIARDAALMAQSERESLRMPAIRVARAAGSLAMLSAGEDEPAGVALEPLAANGALWAFAEHPHREWAALSDGDFRALANACPRSVGATLAADSRMWAARARGGVERSHEESIGAPLSLAPEAPKTAKGGLKKPAAPAASAGLAGRWARRVQGQIDAWEIGFESGAIAALAGAEEGSLLMMGLVTGAPMERVERARAAGLDLKKLGAKDCGEALLRLAFGEDPDARLYQEARPDRRWSMSKAEREELGRIAGARGLERRAERWRLAIELGAPCAELDAGVAHWLKSAPAPAALGVFALEAARGGALKGGWAAATWCSLHAGCPAFAPEIQAVGAGASEAEGPLDFAFKSGLDPAEFDRPDSSRFGFLDGGDATLKSLAKAGVLARRWEGDWWGKSAVAAALEGGVGPQGLMSLARMGASFEAKEKGESVLCLALGLGRPEEEIRPLIKGLLAAAETARKDGGQRLLRERSERSGAGAMCAAARALSSEALEELKAQGLSVGEKDAKGRGLLYWASKKYSDGRQDRLEKTIRWLGANGIDWEARDAKGVSDAGWLAARGSAQRVIAALAAAPREGAQTIEAKALARLSGGQRALVERHLMGAAASPEGGSETGARTAEPGGDEPVKPKAKGPRL